MDPGADGRDDWLAIEPSTRKQYINDLRHVLGWSETVGHLHVGDMTPTHVRAFLDIWRDRPKQRSNVRAMLQALIMVAMEECGVSVNPLDAIKTVRRKVRKGGARRQAVRRWPRSDVVGYAKVAREMCGWRSSRASQVKIPWPGGSILVRLMYETAADSTDIIRWHKGEGGHFVDDPKLPGIDFDRNKTGAEGNFIPISQSLAAEIRASGTFYLVTDPAGGHYRPTIDDSRLRGHMGTLQLHAIAAGYERRIYDHLRHSAATEAVEMGVDLEDVRHLTAHKDSAMNRSVYVQRSREKTVEIQRLRGIIE